MDSETLVSVSSQVCFKDNENKKGLWAHWTAGAGKLWESLKMCWFWPHKGTEAEKICNNERFSRVNF